MSIVNQKEYERARDLGAQARRNGQKESSPYFGYSKRSIFLNEAWRLGWAAENSARKRKNEN